MFFTTPEQNLIMQVLEQTGALHMEHILRLLKGNYPRAEEWYAEKQLRQLRYMGKLVFLDDNTVALPGCATAEPTMLAAVSVMLDISENSPVAVSTAKKPYLLTFLASTGIPKDRLAGFGIFPVREGEEQQAILQAQASTLPHIPVFLLSSEHQQKRISFPCRHYFALYRNGRFQYREGGGAG